MKEHLRVIQEIRNRLSLECHNIPLEPYREIGFLLDRLEVGLEMQQAEMNSLRKHGSAPPLR